MIRTPPSPRIKSQTTNISGLSSNPDLMCAPSVTQKKISTSSERSSKLPHSSVSGRESKVSTAIAIKDRSGAPSTQSSRFSETTRSSKKTLPYANDKEIDYPHTSSVGPKYAKAQSSASTFHTSEASSLAKEALLYKIKAWRRQYAASLERTAISETAKATTPTSFTPLGDLAKIWEHLDLKVKAWITDSFNLDGLKLFQPPVSREQLAEEERLRGEAALQEAQLARLQAKFMGRLMLL